MKVYKSQTRSNGGYLVDIASTTDDYTGYHVLKTGEELSADLRAMALNKLRRKCNEQIDEPTYRIGYIKGVAMMFPHDEATNLDNSEPVIVLTYKEGKLSARANWGTVQAKGEKSGALFIEAINKLIRKVGRDPGDYEYIMGKFRGTHYVLVKGWN